MVVNDPIINSKLGETKEVRLTQYVKEITGGFLLGFSEPSLFVQVHFGSCLRAPTRLHSSFAFFRNAFPSTRTKRDSTLLRWLYLPPSVSWLPPPPPPRTPDIENTMFQLPNGDRSSRGTKLPPHRTGHSSCESAHHRYNWVSLWLGRDTI